MSWWDANDYMVMEMVARDRVGDIHRTADLIRASREVETARDVPGPCRVRVGGLAAEQGDGAVNAGVRPLACRP